MQMRELSDEGSIAQALQDPICQSAFDKIAMAMVGQVNRRAAAAPGPALPVL
jgi:hypothetical protein